MEQQRRKVRTAKAETETPYLGAHDLIFAYEGELDKLLSDEIVAEIKEVRTEEIEGKSRNGEPSKKMRKVLYFKENVKPVIVNAGTRTILEKLRGLFAPQWIGLRVTLFVKWNEMCFGQRQNVLRLKEAPKTAPASLPELTPQHEKWIGAYNAVKAGTTTIEAIRTKYNLSLANETLLND